MPLFAQMAKKIVTVSNFSKKDICCTYKVDESKVSVIYNGGNSNYKPIEEKKKKQFKIKQSQERPYLIYVGSLHKRKIFRECLKHLMILIKMENLILLL